ncbi:uncharacterized protein JCM6883_000843 [Sporobolomyces salmoneus]|uniref:uncharacterized protein n=1 Tax=Sporobolomyces salmoneus TaxID=183962 RepID=UPI003179128D
MSVPTRRYDPSEPRKPSLAKPYRFRPSDNTLSDWLTIGSISCSALAMITRFAIWPWFALLFSISSILGEKTLGPSKSREGNTMFSGWSCLMFALTAMMSIYVPLLTGQMRKAEGIPFGFNKGLIPVPRVG